VPCMGEGGYGGWWRGGYRGRRGRGRGGHEGRPRLHAKSESGDTDGAATTGEVKTKAPATAAIQNTTTETAA